MIVELLFLIVIIYYYELIKETFEPSVAVVGNGPLKESDRYLINKFDKVYRFNDCKNMKKGDKITHLVIRQFNTSERVSGLIKYKSPFENLQNIVFIGSNPSILETIKQNNPNIDCRMISIYEPQVPDSLKYKQDFITYNGNIIKTKYKDWGFSSGFTILSNIPYKNVHIFGMNWNFNENTEHDGKWEKIIIDKNCPKCTIHPTRTNSYL
jgi:hypothetical protein